MTTREGYASSHFLDWIISNASFTDIDVVSRLAGTEMVVIWGSNTWRIYLYFEKHQNKIFEDAKPYWCANL